METLMELKINEYVTIEAINIPLGIPSPSVRYVKKFKICVSPKTLESPYSIYYVGSTYSEVVEFLTALATAIIFRTQPVPPSNIFDTNSIDPLRNTINENISGRFVSIYMTRIETMPFIKGTGCFSNEGHIPFQIDDSYSNTIYIYQQHSKIVESCDTIENLKILFEYMLDNMDGSIINDSIYVTLESDSITVGKLLKNKRDVDVAECYVFPNTDDEKILLVTYLFAKIVISTSKNNNVDAIGFLMQGLSYIFSNSEDCMKVIQELCRITTINAKTLLFNPTKEHGEVILTSALWFVDTNFTKNPDLHIMNNIKSMRELHRFVKALGFVANNIKVDSHINNTNKGVVSEDKPKCPKERVSFDEYFLNIAEVVGTRATCVRRQYGAVITKGNKIISTGYNGSPRNSENCIDIGSCIREEKNIPKGSNYELCKSVHAEQNAIIQGNPESMEGATIYIVGKEVSDGSYANGAPCLICNRMIKNAGIRRVVHRDKNGECVSFFI